MATNSMNELTKQIVDEANAEIEEFDDKKEVQPNVVNAYDPFSGENVSVIPTPNFSGAQSLNTLLPANLAAEIITNVSQLSEEVDLLEFVRRKLGYSSKLKVARCFASEQIDAICLAIKSFERGNGFVLGDMAGIGKGRVCAALMRYAYMNGSIPVFVTIKPHLFNDIYRDFVKIDGIGSSKERDSIPVRPLVLHKDGVIYDYNNPLQPLETKQAIRKLRKKGPDGENLYQYIEYNNPWSIDTITKTLLDRYKDAKSIDDITLEYEVMGDEGGFNAVFLPYSLMAVGGISRRNFLKALAPRSIYIFDESHTAASGNKDSNTLTMALDIIRKCKAILFSSATYAKNPKVFSLYVVRTALSNAVPDLEAINEAIAIGGETVSEYISSGLCYEGEMIRRDRNFADCKKVTEYVGAIREENELGDVTYTISAEDKQKDFYDEAINLFKKLRDFTKNNFYQDAHVAAVKERAAFLGIQLISLDGTGNAYKRVMKLNGKAREVAEVDFIDKHRGKYVPFFVPNPISKYKATFRTNLFLSVKAKFAAEKIVECLNTPEIYQDIDGTTKKTPLKPVIAVVNTGGQLFEGLKLKEGDRIKNDFSEYIRYIYNRLFEGKVTFVKVDDNIFVKKRDIPEDEEQDIETEDYSISPDMFGEAGLAIYEVLDKALKEYKSDIPLSAIDYIRDIITSTRRSDIYFDPVSKMPLYGRLDTFNYTFGEGTARKHMLVKDGDEWVFTKNDRPYSITKLFKGFNNGVYDVILINTTASTGGSAHSAIDEGRDVRKRNMFIIQSELDINVEVQKRGRVNRTGQLNYPTYTYVITQIPAEQRQYLMLRRKLRKLDANVRGDQSASAKGEELRDLKGNIINDIYNKYGYDVFIRDFIANPDNALYADILQQLIDEKVVKSSSSTSTGTAADDEANLEQFNEFTRELEMYPCDVQQVFFDEMQRLYEDEKRNLIQRGEYQEELKPKNYKAKLRQRVVKEVNAGNSIFSLPLFLSDYYTIDDFIPWDKNKWETKKRELAKWDGKDAMEPREFHIKLLDEFQAKKDIPVQELEDRYDLKKPDPKDYTDPDEYIAELAKWQDKKTSAVKKLEGQLDTLWRLYSFFKPGRAVAAPARSTPLKIGVFVGYKIEKWDRPFPFNAGNVKLVICYMSEVAVQYTPAADAENIKSVTLAMEQGPDGTNYWQVVNEWKPILNRRVIKRFYTGNILSGYVRAYDDMLQYGEGNAIVQPITKFYLSKFSNIDGSYTTAVELELAITLNDNTVIKETDEELLVSVGSEPFRRYALNVPLTTSERFPGGIFPVWNVENDKLCDRGLALIRREDSVYVDGVTKNINIIEFRVVEHVKRVSIKGKGPKQYTWRYRNDDDPRYNRLYHDDDFLNQYIQYNTYNTPDPVNIRYAIRPLQGGQAQYDTLYCMIKHYAFDVDNQSSLDDYISFITKLYVDYDVKFSFRSGVEAYYNMDVTADEPLDKQTKGSEFPTGEYEYVFERKVSDAILQQIPLVIRKTTTGLNGGVILSGPLNPNTLPGYDLLPYKISPTILMKLLLAVLNSEQKVDFVREVTKVAETGTNQEVGDFVRVFMKPFAVPMKYFFGLARIEDYGRLVKDYVQNQDISKLVLDETMTSDKPNVEDVVDDENAVTFMLKLLQLI